MQENTIELQRSLLQELISWKSKRKRKPLLLQGARQVGKSWLLKQFGSVAFDNFVVVNIDRETSIREIFERTKEPRRIIEQISLIKGQKILPEKTLLILDEIQDSDEVLNSLKYFNEDAPEYALACAGSLLGVALRKKNRSFPVGQVDFMTLYPLSFVEFLSAVDSRLCEIVRQWKMNEPLPEILRQELAEKLKVYFAVGGMPEAVVDWIETSDFQVVNQTLDGILQAYPLDFSKYATASEVVKINQVWNSLQRQLAKDNKKFKYSEIQKGARAREYENAVDWLCCAGLVHKVRLVETPMIPIKAYCDESVFKLYVNDIGLLRRMFNLDGSSILQSDQLFREFKGVMSENYILLSLLRQQPSYLSFEQTSLFYWSSGNQAEIEFMLEHNGKIIPIEVKSSESIRAKSLSSYRKQYNPELSVRFSLKNLQLRDGFLDIPHMLADRLFDGIDSFDNLMHNEYQAQT